KPGKLISTVSGGAPTACSTMEIEPVSGGTVNATVSPTVRLPSRCTREGGREEPATGARQAAGADSGPTTPPLRRPTRASGGRQPVVRAVPAGGADVRVAIEDGALGGVDVGPRGRDGQAQRAQRPPHLEVNEHDVGIGLEGAQEQAVRLLVPPFCAQVAGEVE